MTNQPTNENNENNFVNLVNSCNVNNDEIIQINASSAPAVQQGQQQDDLVSSLTSKPSSIYWNEQNEEAFLQEIELQNLFANTLLHDDFADEADFTCLGIDQLQLNYPSVATNNQNPIANSNPDHESLISKQNDDFIHISHQTLQQSEAEAAAATEQFNTFNSIDLSSVTSLINENNLAINNRVIQSESEPEPDTHSQIQTQTHKQLNASDDSVFKKPNLIDSFFSNSTSNNKLINLIEPIELISQLKKINTQVKSSKQELNEKQQQQQPATNGFLANSLFSLKRSRKRSKLLALGPTAAAAAGLNSKLTVNGQDSALITSVQNTTSNTKLSNSKLIKLNIQNKKEKKEKLKQTKGLLSEPSNKKFAACVTAVVHEELPISATLNSLMLKTKKEDVDLHIKELSLLDLHSSEEDSAEILIKNALNAKFKKDVRSSSNENSQSNGIAFFPATTNNNSNIIKSSTNNQLNEIISKRIKYSTNPLNEVTDNFSKVSPISPENQFNQSQVQSEFTSESLKKERRIDKLIQYLTKSSLDSAGSSNCSMSSSTSSNESLQIQQLNSSESFLIINNFLTKNETTLSNPICAATSTVNNNTSYVTSSNQQNKRKKNDASDTQQQQQQQLLISSSLPIEIQQQKKTPTPQLSAQNSTELSKSLTIIDRYIENDTLQHMKNLDLNFDLKPNEFSNGFSSSSSSSSSCSSSTISTKPKEKNIYKKNKKSLHSMGNNLEQLTVSLQQQQQQNQQQKQQQQQQPQTQPQPLATANESANLGIDLNDACSRKTLWNLLKAHSSQEEMMDEFGSQLHDKISFWDLVKLKLKFSKSTQLKTTYEIIDDYTVLYSNMSTLLESFVEEHSSSTSSSTAASTASKLTLKKIENSSRSRSSSRNCRKQSSNSSSTLSHRI